MLYRVIGVMSGSSLDGLDLAFVELEESGGKWVFEIKAAQCMPYSHEWLSCLQGAAQLTAYDYLLLDTALGKYIGEKVNDFIEQFGLHHQVQLIASHGHTVFHAPYMGMTAQLGDGAAIAAATEINVVSDLRALDVALGGQGAPIVPLGEKLLLPQYDFFLNLGGIANLSHKGKNGYIAFDVCAANRVLNMLAATEGRMYDEDGDMAAAGHIHTPLLTQLNALEYYAQEYPKSLANSFGTATVYPLIQSFDISTADKLCTYTNHIAMQTGYAAQNVMRGGEMTDSKIMVTGGGAHNKYLVGRIKNALQPLQIEVVVPEAMLINYKESLIMALLGVLRWREENTVLQSVTGATRSSIGGAVWIGQEA